METTAYYAFGVPLYLGLVVAEWLRMKKRGARTPTFSPSFGNVSAGLGSIVVGLFLGPALLALYAFAHRHFALINWEKGSIAPWILAVVLADFGHYWHHRLDHRVAACWAVHGVHHMPEEMNFTVAMRHAWFSDLYSFPFYAPLPLLGVPASHFFVATTFLSFHALITHSEHFDFPSFGFLVTPRSHVLHHARNAPYMDTNYGAMLAIWDRIFGTSSRWDGANPPEYGTHRGYATHDGALAQWVLWRDLVDAAKRERTLAGKLRVFFGRPARRERIAPPPPSSAISGRTKAYVAIQLLLTIAFSLYVFVLRDDHSWWFKLAGAIAILAAMVTLGGLLDARPRAKAWETARVFATLALAARAILPA